MNEVMSAVIGFWLFGVFWIAFGVLLDFSSKGFEKIKHILILSAVWGVFVLACYFTVRGCMQ